MKWDEWRHEISDAIKILAAGMQKPAAQQTHEREGIFREALSTLSAHFLNAPAAVNETFCDFEEAELERATTNRINQFEGERFDVQWQNDLAADTLTAAAYVRALDRELHSFSPSHFGSKPLLEEAYKTKSKKFFVVPRAIRRKFPRRSQPFRKRGLLCNRVLPTEVQGLDVRLTQHRTSRTDPDNLVFGAALFKQYDLKTFSSDRAFRLTDVEFEDLEGMISQQVTSAVTEGCSILAWPELMVPPSARDHIVQRLRETVINHTNDKVPDLVVAGTWHAPCGEETWQNVGYVFTGAGKPLLNFAKVKKFYLRSGNTQLGEDIKVGDEIQILLTDFGAVAFGICKDFCDVESHLLEALDIDLFIVPSLGNESTMDGHCNNGTRLKHASGARTFVVQQHISNPPEEKAPDPLGWVIAPGKQGSGMSKMVQDLIWQDYS